MKPKRDGKNYVPDAGSRDARIVAIGEAPGATENSMRRPFVGAAGTLLARWLRRVGLKRSDLYITNTFPWQPPANDLSRIPETERRQYAAEMVERILELPNVRVIVPMGNYAMQAIIGKTGITKHRGSIYQWEGKKVIPTLHPAAIFRSQSWERRCIRDWQRIVWELDHDEPLPVRHHEIMPTIREIEDFVEHCREAEKLAIDIETPVKWKKVLIGHTKKGTPRYKKEKGQRFVACVGFADSATHSLTIPTTRSYWGSKEKLHRAWELIEELCDLPCAKIFQNGWFDTFHLERLGIHVRNWKWDTMALHHCLIPNEEHSLQFMASVDSREPYWKDEGKSQDKGVPVDLETWWTYNGKDCCVTYELCDTYIERLRQQDKLKLYLMHHRKLFRPLLEMSLDGIRSDETIRKKRFAHLTADLIEARTELTTMAGEELYGKLGSLSPLKLKKYLYTTLNLKPILRRNTKGEMAESTNEITVRKLMLIYPKRKDVQQAGGLILLIRRTDKLRSFYANRICDEDGRVRCTYSVAPESGRLSSSKNPMGSGMNLQNVDREGRDHFVPDEGHIFVRVDMSQAESRWVYMLTGDPEMIRLARAMPWTYDDHSATAAVIFSVAESNVSKDQRFFGKKTNHASNYDMQGTKMSEEVLKDGVVLTPEECQAMIEAKMNWRPAIRDVFQKETRRQVITERKLTNSWGFALDFTDVRLGPEIFRECYAFRASSEVAFTINQYGMIPLKKELRGMESKLRNQVHDELVVSCPPNEAWDVWQFLKQSLERPRPTPYGELIIPVEIKVGMSWSGGHEWKKPPSKRDFNDVVHGLVDGNP